MTAFGYPDHDSHKSEYLEFVAEAAGLKFRVDSWALILFMMTPSLPGQWLHNHIFGPDINYAGFFSANGLK